MGSEMILYICTVCTVRMSCLLPGTSEVTNERLGQLVGGGGRRNHLIKGAPTHTLQLISPTSSFQSCHSVCVLV